jgi:hypothetical protein
MLKQGNFDKNVFLNFWPKDYDLLSSKKKAHIFKKVQLDIE